MVKPYRFHGRLGLGPMMGLERSNALPLGMRLCATASGSRSSSGRNGRTSSGRAASARSMATASGSQRASRLGALQRTTLASYNREIFFTYSLLLACEHGSFVEHQLPT